MFTLLLLLACHGDPKTPDPAPVGEGLLLGGCPGAGQATARVLTDPAERPWGPDALATPGDVLLLSSRAAFVISAAEDPQTYYHYGGIPIDAVALDGCAQAGPETLGEAGFALGKLDLGDFEASALRQIRATSVEIVADGADGGPAVVEVHGTDDRFWLVEMTLIRGSYAGGTPRALTDLYGLDITVTYTLDPDSDVLQVSVQLDGEPADDGFLVGALLFPSDHTRLSAYSASSLSFGGFHLTTSVPWAVDGGPEGSHATAMPGAAVALATVAGVSAMIDLNQAVAPLELDAPGGADPVPFLLSVSAGDPASAGAALRPYLDAPLPTRETAWVDLDGVVTDASGAGIAEADVTAYAQDDDGGWVLLDRLITGEDGAFSGTLLDVGTPWRLVAEADGRDASAALELAPEDATGLTFALGPAGSLDLQIADPDGAPLPARVALTRDDGLSTVIYAIPGDDPAPLPPGDWTATVSRGYEYSPERTTFTMPEDGTATLSVVLTAPLDTTGWASMDTHVHSGPSPDAETLPEDRMRTVVAAGLDVMVGTDHEAIVDLSAAVDDAGVGDWMSYGLGSEVTCTVPEHINAWPFPVDDSQARGSPVVWYGQGFPDVYAVIRERGASVIQLNHSRVNGECGILCVLDWDRMDDDPTIADPTVLGMDPGEVVWSWDFDSMEVMNGLRSPFLLADDPRRSGALNDWMAFLNLGHRVTGVAVTDVHGPDIPGSPRTYVAVADDTPGGVDLDDLASGVLRGAAVISAGAFLEVTLDGAGPGEDVHVAGEGTLDLRVQALPEIDVTTVRVLAGCDEVLTLEATDPDAAVKLDTSEVLGFSQDTWLIALAFGSQPMPAGLDDYDPASVPRAISNPIYIDADGDGIWTPPGARVCDWAP